MGVGCCSILAGTGGIELTDVIPAPGYVLGALTAWVIQIPAPSRTLFHVPPENPFRPGRSLRFAVAFLLFMVLGVSRGCLYGLLAGNVLLAILARYRNRLQLTGVLLRVLAPVLLAALAIRVALLLGRGTGADGLWWTLLAISLSTAGICWSLPYGKKLSWWGTWSFPFPRVTPPEPSRTSADPAVDQHAGSGRAAPPSRHQTGGSGTRARAQTVTPRNDTPQVPRHTLLPGQSPRRGAVLWLAAWPCCLMALGLSFWALHHVLAALASRETAWQAGLFAILVMMSVSAFNQSRKLFLRGRRHLGLPIASPHVLHPGSYVLYLRSFEDDEARTALQKQRYEVSGLHDLTGDLIGLAVSSRDEEEHIADAMRPVGPLVAVGAPDEVLPFAGAVRMYLPRTSWQPSVRQLMRQARLVTLTLGSSAGTMWEVSEAMCVLPPQRLLLLVPGMMSEEEYERIRRRNETTLLALPESSRNHTWRGGTPPSLPDCASHRRFVDPVIGFIHFSADWEPTFTRTPGNCVPWENRGPSLPWENLCGSLVRGLRPAFEQLAAHEEETGRHCG